MRTHAQASVDLTRMRVACRGKAWLGLGRYGPAARHSAARLNACTLPCMAIKLFNMSPYVAIRILRTAINTYVFSA